MARFLSEDIEIEERVIDINRVAKVVKGGRRFNLTSLVAVGDRNGNVGVGHGKGNEVPLAVRKATAKARKNLAHVNLKGTSIPHQVIGRFGAARVLLKPAAPGTGIIAGGPVRAVVELAGIKDILAKSLGSSNPINLARATMQGLLELKSASEVSEMRGVQLKEVELVEKLEKIRQKEREETLKRMKEEQEKDKALEEQKRRTKRRPGDRRVVRTEKVKKVEEEKARTENKAGVPTESAGVKPEVEKTKVEEKAPTIKEDEPGATTENVGKEKIEGAPVEELKTEEAPKVEPKAEEDKSEEQKEETKEEK